MYELSYTYKPFEENVRQLLLVCQIFLTAILLSNDDFLFFCSYFLSTFLKKPTTTQVDAGRTTKEMRRTRSGHPYFSFFDFTVIDVF